MKTELNPKSKLSILISEEIAKSKRLSVKVYYSENDWETYTQVELIIEENTNIADLIDLSIVKLKNEFNKEIIQSENYDILLFKKKTKKPKYDYPKCYLESLVKDFGKFDFCLVEKENKQSSNIYHYENILYDEDSENINIKEDNLGEKKLKSPRCFGCEII